MYNSPRLFHSLFLAIIAAVLFTLSKMFVTPDLSAGVALVAMICSVFSAGYGLNWFLYAMSQRFRQYQDARSVSPILRAMEAAARLTPEQAALVPKYTYGLADVAYDFSKRDVRAYLMTPGAHVPWEFVERFLERSTNMHLAPINTTHDKTPERRYAQALTEWCIYQGYATPATGPYPAAWVGEGRRKVAALLHIDLSKPLGEDEK